MKKEAQIHIGENVAILFIFFILLVVSLVFYARLSETQIGSKQEEIFAAKALQIAQRLSYLPETQCSKDNVAEGNCYDFQKLEALADITKITEYKSHYFSMFQYANVTVHQIFPKDEKMLKANIYNNVPEKWVEKQSVQIPVSICDYTEFYGRCIFAVMTVDVFR